MSVVWMSYKNCSHGHRVASDSSSVKYETLISHYILSLNMFERSHTNVKMCHNDMISLLVPQVTHFKQ